MNVSLLKPHEHSVVLNFVAQHPRAHFHLDWEPIYRWLPDRNNHIFLLWQHEYLIGVLAFAPIHHKTTWIRLLALPIDREQAALKLLWDYAYSMLAEKIHLAALMTNQAWLLPLLQGIGFYEQDRVINLRRPRQDMPASPQTAATIRKVRWLEFKQVLHVDNTAFAPLWQMRSYDLREAVRRAQHYRVAVIDGEVVGYELTMGYSNSMHLARLATLPNYQGQRIGKALVYNMLHDAEEKGTHEVTVNTQASNISSQRVYEYFGFEHHSNDYWVYVYSMV